MSEVNNALPQFNRAEIETDVGFYKTLFRLIETGREHILPAIVEKYDRPTGIATVKPLAKYVYDTKDGEKEEDRLSVDVPVWRFVQGGFIIDAPLYVGSTGYLFAVDRNCKDIVESNSEILVEDQNESDAKNVGAGRPNDCSLASFANGFFLPFSWGDTKISDSDDLIVSKSNTNGEQTRISIGVYSVSAKSGTTTLYSSNEKRYVVIDADKISLVDADNNAEITISGGKISAKVGDSSSTEIANNGISSVFGSSKVAISNKQATITNGTDTIEISTDGIRHTGPIDFKKTIVTDVRFDKTLHQLQKKTVLASFRGDFIVGHDDETDWTKAEGGQAVPEYT